MSPGFTDDLQEGLSDPSGTVTGMKDIDRTVSTDTEHKQDLIPLYLDGRDCSTTGEDEVATFDSSDVTGLH
jgi:hypothetical protein